MSMSDFIKATLICAGIAYLIYRFPLISQILLIGSIAAIWASYFYRAVISRRAT
jgi:hypothetical protein